MKRLRLCFLVPLSIFCCQMTAQVDDLMRDKNITWIAESYNDFLTDESAAETIGKRISGARLLKFYNPTEGGMPEEFVLQDFILELAKAGQLLKQEIFFSNIHFFIAEQTINPTAKRLES